jgi:hypothetical protein
LTGASPFGTLNKEKQAAVLWLYDRMNNSDAALETVKELNWDETLESRNAPKGQPWLQRRSRESLR